MSKFAPSGQAVPSVINISAAENPFILNISMLTANTEYSATLPVGTKKFYIRLRNKLVNLQLSYILGDSGITYVTIPQGVTHGESGLGLTVPVGLYFQTNQPSQTAEVVYWTD